MMCAHGMAELRARSGRPARAKMLTVALWSAWARHPQAPHANTACDDRFALSVYPQTLQVCNVQRGSNLARRSCSGIGIQLGAGEPPIAAIGIGFRDSLRHGRDTVTQGMAGRLQSRQGTTSPCEWLHVPCNAWATAGRSTPSNPFDGLGRFQKCPRRQPHDHPWRPPV